MSTTNGKTPVSAETQTLTIDVTVDSAAGGAGSAIANTDASSSLRVLNTGEEPFEVKVGSGAWSGIAPKNELFIDADLSATTVYLRKAEFARASTALVSIVSIDTQFFAGEDPVDIGGGGGGGDVTVINNLTSTSTTAALSAAQGKALKDTADGLATTVAAKANSVSPSFTTPALGTPSSGVMTNVTGLPTSGLVDGAVTLAKMANLAQDQFIGRTTASSGVPQTATITAAARTVLDDTTVDAMINTLGGASASGTGGLVRASAPVLTGATAAADPSAALGLATKQYVDGIAANLGKRQRVRAATTANITIATALNAGDVLDGVTLVAGDLVLVKDQSTGAQNGIIVVGASPARAPEFDTYDEHPGSLIVVQEGTANADTLWLCTSNVGGTLDSTAIAFSSFSAPTSAASVSITDTGGYFTGTNAETVTQEIGASLATKAVALTAGTTITTSRDLAAGDVDKITTVDTSSGDVTLTLVTGALTAAGQAMYFRRSGANDLLFASGTATVNNTKGVIALDGDLVVLMATAANVASVEGDERIRRLQANPATDDTYQGDVTVGLNAGATIAQWDAVYLNSSSQWVLADADGSGTFPARGLAVSSGTSDNPLSVLKRGIVRNDAWSWTPGGDIFLSTTAGGLTQTAPANAQRVGYAKTADVAEFDFTSAALVLPVGAAAGGQVRIPFLLPIAVGDEATALTTGAAKFSFHMPFAMTLTDIQAGVVTAPTGAALVVDVNEAGSTLMTTNKLTIDVSELSTHTAATPPALTDTALAKGALITIDIDTVGSSVAGAGLKVYFVGYITAF